MDIDVKELISIKEAASMLRVSKAALICAITKERLQAVKRNGKLYTTIKWTYHYLATKYNRDFSKWNGSSLYNKEAGEISLDNAAKMAGISYNNLYYLIKKNLIPSFRKGKAIILKIEDVSAFIKNQKKEVGDWNDSKE